MSWELLTGNIIIVTFEIHLFLKYSVIERISTANGFEKVFIATSMVRSAVVFIFDSAYPGSLEGANSIYFNSIIFLVCVSSPFFKV